MRPRYLIAALACVAALASAGCGSSTVSATLDPVAQAADATTQLHGAQLTIAMTMDLDGHQLTANGHGDMDMSKDEGELFLEMTGLSALSNGQAPSQVTMTELLAHDSVYVGSSLFGGELPGGAHWVKVDLAHEAGTLGLEPQALSSGESDPSQFLQYLRASSGSVTQTGSATIRGVHTTEYSATIELDKAAKLLAKGDSATQSKLEATFAKTGFTSLPVHVWIDARHLVRKLQMQMNMSISGQSIDTSIVEELFGFGPVPGVNVPSGGEVYEPPLPDLSSLSG